MSNVVMLPQRARANECWDFPKAQAFLSSLEDLLGTPGKRPRFKAQLATGRQFRYHFKEAEPDDFYIVFRKASGFLSNQTVSIHQSAFRSFFEVARTDKSSRPAILYTVDDISELVDRVRMAAIYEVSGPLMNNAANTNTNHAKVYWWRENWFIVLGLFGLIGFGIHQGNRLNDNVRSSEVRLDQKIDTLRSEVGGKLDKQSADVSDIKAALARIEGKLDAQAETTATDSR